VVSVAAGAYHTLALKSDGTVWAWGYNAQGQLGNGNTTSQRAPVQVTGLSGVSAIASGDTHSIALKSDGTVSTWGNNGLAQLGDGAVTPSEVNPVSVSTVTGMSSTGGGNAFSLARKSDGTVWAWGLNTSGQLGDGTTTQRPALCN
jgi:YD repeat-containing protein